MLSPPFHNVLRLFSILSLVLLIVGCVSEAPHEGLTFIRYTEEPFPPTKTVEVFSEDVDKPYTTIGELKMTFFPELGDEEMVNRMREVARGIGADAIVGLEREVVEIAIPGVSPEPIKRKARHQPLDISSPEAKEERVLLRGLAIRYQ